MLMSKLHTRSLTCSLCGSVQDTVESVPYRYKSLGPVLSFPLQVSVEIPPNTVSFRYGKREVGRIINIGPDA